MEQLDHRMAEEEAALEAIDVSNPIEVERISESVNEAKREVESQMRDLERLRSEMNEKTEDNATLAGRVRKLQKEAEAERDERTRLEKENASLLERVQKAQEGEKLRDDEHMRKEETLLERAENAERSLAEREAALSSLSSLGVDPASLDASGSA